MLIIAGSAAFAGYEAVKRLINPQDVQALGFPLADPIVGLLITVAILFVLRDAAREIYHRLMDAVDPKLVAQAGHILTQVPEVERVGSVRLRWLGHVLRAEVDIVVRHDLSLLQAHAVAVEAEHRLIHDLPRLRAATVHADPDGPAGTDHHAVLPTHRQHGRKARSGRIVGSMCEHHPFAGVHGGNELLRALPKAARALMWVRILNALGAYALSFLAVLAGPELAPVALAVFGVTALASRWAGAFLLDRFSPRGVLAAGLAATGLALIALTLAQGPAQVLAAIALVGLAFELYEPASQELLARASSGEQRHATYAVMGVVLSAGGAAAGLLAAVLLPLGVRWLVAVDALTCLMAAAVAVVFLPREDGARGARGARRDTVGGRWRPPAALMRLTVAGTAFAVGYLAVMMYLPLALLERGAPAWVPGLTLAGAAILAPLALWAARRLLAGRAHGVILGVGTLLLAGLALVMALTTSTPLTIASYLACTAVNSVLLGRWQSVVADAAPEPDRPRWFAFQGSSWGVAQPAVPPLAALAGGVVGTAGAGAFLAAGVAFLLVPFILRRVTT
ncbi:MFS family permease [Streptosporangium album]|uniref:MFS family permease n=1 Tax=Streptosporangium album TaxID=47479 RepID=A0A7W7WAV9_9ACTN|nr:MFS family permease [Streptosporangium album]